MIFYSLFARLIKYIPKVKDIIRENGAERVQQDL